MSKLKQKHSESRHSTSSEEEDEEDDVIRCICESTVDDGFTIQCEKCDVWQHAKCYRIKKKNIPEHFICDRCLGKKPHRRSSLDSSLEKAERKKKAMIKRDKKRARDSDEEIPKKFIPINKSIAKEKVVQDLFIEVHRQWIESNRPKNGTASKKTGNKGLDSIVVMESNLLLPAIPKASLKPIRKSLRGTSFFQKKNDPSVKKGVFADIHIPENRYLMEVTGQVVRKSEYKTESRNRFSALGTPLPHVFFYPSLDICIDARYTGNDTRFIRRSCCPNSEMKSIILPNDSEDQTIHMGVYTKEAIDKGEEITIGWSWHRGHIMWKKSKEFTSKSCAEVMDEAEKKSLQETLDLLNLEFGKCACEDEEDCLFEYLKDELERKEEEQEDSEMFNKKISAKSRKEIVKPTYRTTIFTSDEDENSKPRKQSNISLKQVKFIEKSNSMAPSSPAVSVEESVDIDITSMSPAPEEVSIGSKRNRVSAGIQLPCKKKWLHDYIIQQQQQKQLQQQEQQEQQEQQQIEVSTLVDVPVSKASSTVNIVSSKQTKELEHVYGEGNLSDGGSSQSTLPPDDISLSTKVDMERDKEEISKENNRPKAEEATISEKRSNIVQEVKFEDKIVADLLPPDINANIETTVGPSESFGATNNMFAAENKSETTISPLPESSESYMQSEEGISSFVECPAPKVKKLSIQEYLKRQRGNLPTPDEKP